MSLSICKLETLGVLQDVSLQIFCRLVVHHKVTLTLIDGHDPKQVRILLGIDQIDKKTIVAFPLGTLAIEGILHFHIFHLEIYQKL